MRHILTIALLSLATGSQADVTAFEHSDSLKSENPLKCVSPEEVEPTSTAADIAQGALHCFKKRRYEEAAALVFVASAFVDFDTRRVVDSSAHAARQALFAETFSGQSEQKIGEMFQAMDGLSPGSVEHTEICEHLRLIGPPKYFPKYMIAHGLAAFTGSNDQMLVEPFDAESAWSASLTQFTNCVESN